MAIANPLDYHTYCWGNREVMEATYLSMTAIGFDMNYLILDFPHPTRCDDWEWHIAVDAFEKALKENQAKGAFVVGMAENIPEDYTDNYSERGIVSFTESTKPCKQPKLPPISASRGNRGPPTR